MISKYTPPRTKCEVCPVRARDQGLTRLGRSRGHLCQACWDWAKALGYWGTVVILEHRSPGP